MSPHGPSDGPLELTGNYWLAVKSTFDLHFAYRFLNTHPTGLPSQFGLEQRMSGKRAWASPNIPGRWYAVGAIEDIPLNK
mmetsp:Transcript_742/g.1537  ORF Transcript_742/g.1537 Transcript_742/m.1537 type:complete len:80 (+) Transcript_742:169-408(+)